MDDHKSKKDTLKEDGILFFDDECLLCNTFIKLLLKLDRNASLKYTSLLGKTAEKILPQEYKTNKSSELPSVIYFKNGKFHLRSNAILEAISDIYWPYKIVKLSYIIPRIIRDFIYDLVANNRYKLFGKQDYCSLPDGPDKGKFLP